MFDTLLSVILPAYNAEKYISETINSILSQTFSDFELLICDDCSSDKTWGIIKNLNDSRIRIFRNEKNLGKTHTCNKLFNFTKGKYLTIHDADDISLADRFDKQIHFLENNIGYGLVGCNFLEIDQMGKEFSRSNLVLDNETIKAKINVCSQFHGPTMVFEKRLINKYNGIYRPYFENHNEDTDLAYRLLELKMGANISDHLYLYRINPQGLSKKKLTPKKRNLYSVVVWLAKQRQERGYDDLMINRPDLVDAYLDTILIKYQKDKSLIYRERASFLNYYRLHNEAVVECFKGLIKKPFIRDNYGALWYSLKLFLSRYFSF
jgi:glycosyltransferase involved in cell wall biosynthesis